MAKLEQTNLLGDVGCLRPGARTQSLEETANVNTYGWLRNTESRGDLTIGEATGHQLQDLILTGCDLGRAVGGIAGGVIRGELRLAPCCAAHRGHYVVEGTDFIQIATRAQSHQSLPRASGAVPGHDQDCHLRGRGADAPNYFETVHARHVQV